MKKRCWQPSAVVRPLTTSILQRCSFSFRNIKAAIQEAESEMRTKESQKSPCAKLCTLMSHMVRWNQEPLCMNFAIQSIVSCVCPLEDEGAIVFSHCIATPDTVTEIPPMYDPSFRLVVLQWPSNQMMKLKENTYIFTTKVKSHPSKRWST